MKLENIETNLGNRVVDDLQQSGWKVSAQYSPLAFDKGIDFDSYTLKRGGATLQFEWSNWFEWEVEGEEADIQFLVSHYKLNREGRSESVVKSWFGDAFKTLHPLLQKLHITGGKLIGDVDIVYGKGLAGVIGRRLAAKMNLPAAGTHHLVVSISHDTDGLHWGRCFNGQVWVESLFQPVGSIGQGYWIESTGPLQMRLTVDIDEGGWYWRCLSVTFSGIPIPQWLVPKTTAYKRVENDQYRFFVELSLPVIGSLVAYQGLLSAESNA